MGLLGKPSPGSTYGFLLILTKVEDLFSQGSNARNREESKT
jgi:hypothetical protein